MYFRYNGDDTLIGFELNGTDYYYVKNLQGNIISILDSTGADVVDYTYDAWGKLLTTTGSLASTVGVLNPFRYRSYYYDTETGLFYVGSRYYNPEIGRFINTDDTSTLQMSQGQLLGANLFAYCGNNPVMLSDEGGDWPSLKSIVGCLNTYIGGWYSSGKITIFYWGVHSPQSLAGYSNIIDSRGAMGLIGCNLAFKTTYFNYSEKLWRIELWKGSYAFGAMYGGEIAIYYGTSQSGWFNCATNNLVTMSFKLYDKNNNLLFSTNSIKTWWETGFVLGSKTKDQLTMRATFNFSASQRDFMNAFVNALPSYGINPTVSGLTVSFTW